MKNLKPFNLERALAGEKVVDEQGREYKEFYLFKEIASVYRPLICLMNGEIHYFNKEGSLNECIPYLFMAPKTKTYWINIYKDAMGNIWGSMLHHSEDKAERMKEVDHGYIKTISFEIEE